MLWRAQPTVKWIPAAATDDRKRLSVDTDDALFRVSEPGLALRR
jgi:hypothetical protein